MTVKKWDLTTTVAGVTFPNPVIAASGVYGFGENYTDLYRLNLLGGISCKGLTLHKRHGNTPPRVAETPAGMLNSVGLQNPGIDTFIEKHLPRLKKDGNVIIANIAGDTPEDYAEIARKLDATDVDMLEVNISCPNVQKGGSAWGVSTEGAGLVTKTVRAATKKPIMVKLTPNVTDITEIARAVESEGADAISLINTLLGMRIDIRTKRPVLHRNVGGLSGPAVFPVALRMVWQVVNSVKIDVVGMGGINSGEDAVEMMLAGAKAVQIGTAIVSDPLAPQKIIGGIEHYLDINGIKRISDVIGKVEPW